MYKHGHEYIPDDLFTIGDILENSKSTLGYLYDLVGEDNAAWLRDLLKAVICRVMTGCTTLLLKQSSRKLTLTVLLFFSTVKVLARLRIWAAEIGSTPSRP